MSYITLVSMIHTFRSHVTIHNAWIKSDSPEIRISPMSKVIVTPRRKLKANLGWPIAVAMRSKVWGLRPLAGWDCGFEYCRGHECFSLVSVVCCQVLSTGRSDVQSALPSVRMPLYDQGQQ